MEPIDLHECSDGTWRAGHPVRLTKLDADGRPVGPSLRTVVSAISIGIVPLEDLLPEERDHGPGTLTDLELNRPETDEPPPALLP